MSPEILLGTPFYLPTDFFSLGIIFSEIAARVTNDLGGGKKSSGTELSMTLYGTQKCEAFKYFPFAATLVSEAILGSCSLRAADLAGATSELGVGWTGWDSLPDLTHVLLVSASRSGDPEMQRACIVALVTHFVEVLASPVASVDETHVPKLYGICTGSCSMPW
ncbi:hypothetical protein JB92DRAFT_3096855 [Gautieria morchelliformis]|nr:hypothetical protein JB92DRAFT_3096855 [Gautieria morchelliformis]